MLIASFDIGTKNLAYCIEDTMIHKIVALELLDIRRATIQKQVQYLIQCLDKQDLFTDCTTILIEQQMKVNAKALAMQHYIYMYFIMRLPHATLVYIPSRWKTVVLQAPTSLSYYRRKRWAICMAKKLLEMRDESTYKLSESKADDYADTILQLHAYMIKKDIDAGIDRKSWMTTFT